MSLRALNNRRWSAEETDIVQNKYGFSSPEGLLRLLPGRTWLAIQGRARRLGIKREVNTCHRSLNTARIFAVEREKLAYLAGFFDGEGSFHYGVCQGSSVSWRICAYNTDINPLRLFLETFGGAVYEHKASRLGHKIVYCWDLSGVRAKRAIELMLPYLQVKAEKARVALKLYKFYRRLGTTSNEERLSLINELRR